MARAMHRVTERIPALYPGLAALATKWTFVSFGGESFLHSFAKMPNSLSEPQNAL
jgi:hypothetical protein